MQVIHTYYGTWTFLTGIQLPRTSRLKKKTSAKINHFCKKTLLSQLSNPLIFLKVAPKYKCCYFTLSKLPLPRKSHKAVSFHLWPCVSTKKGPSPLVNKPAVSNTQNSHWWVQLWLDCSPSSHHPLGAVQTEQPRQLFSR